MTELPPSEPHEITDAPQEVDLEAVRAQFSAQNPHITPARLSDLSEEQKARLAPPSSERVQAPDLNNLIPRNISDLSQRPRE